MIHIHIHTLDITHIQVAGPCHCRMRRLSSSFPLRGRRLPVGLGLLLLLLLLVSSTSSGSSSSGSESVPRVEVILVGATSSLARKYLFQSFFRAFLEEELKPAGAGAGGTDPSSNSKVSLRLYGGATRAPEEGKRLLGEYLESSTSCQGLGGPECARALAAFRQQAEYVQLRGEAQYAELGRRLREQEKRDGDGKLAGRLVYLSISPDLYPSVAKAVAEHLRPTQDSGGHGSGQAPWLRVVFEKPFGRDLASAERLAAELQEYLKEEEIYRVDHYMGKAAVQAILPFRHANRAWFEGVWNAEHVERIEVAMKETEDCEGRTAFYEGYGVIRDVLQNHLTQVLCLLKMDLPAASSNDNNKANPQEAGAEAEDPGVFGSHQHRTNVLKELRLHGGDADSRATIHVGQYQGYHAHVAADRKTPERPHFTRTTVPTAAAVTLGSAHPRWQGVQFVLKAGKALDARTSYAKATLRAQEQGKGPKCELHFSIQGGPLGTAIAWDTAACAGLLDPARVHVPLGWVKEDKEKGKGKDGGMFVLRPAAGAAAPNAYDVVVEEVLEGDRSMFLGTEELLHAWRLWDSVLAHADKMEPAIYPLGFDIDEIEAVGLVGVGAGAGGGFQGEEL